MLERLSLEGRTIILTGGGTGLGRRMALHLAAAGADLAGLLVYLCSDACDLVTGHTIFVDSGAMARL